MVPSVVMTRSYRRVIRRTTRFHHRPRGDFVSDEHAAITDDDRADAAIIWNYHQLHHR
jgi:hypothetical protein